MRSAPEEQLPLGHRLDRGEIEAIVLASSLNADYLLLDDKRAQKEAHERGLVVIPTFAILKGCTKGDHSQS